MSDNLEILKYMSSGPLESGELSRSSIQWIVKEIEKLQRQRDALLAACKCQELLEQYRKKPGLRIKAVEAQLTKYGFTGANQSARDFVDEITRAAIAAVEKPQPKPADAGDKGAKP